MKTYSCSSDNIDSKKVMMTNKAVRKSSKCANRVANKSKYLKQKSNKKLVGTKLILNYSYIKFKLL